MPAPTRCRERGAGPRCGASGRDTCEVDHSPSDGHVKSTVPPPDQGAQERWRLKEGRVRTYRLTPGPLRTAESWLSEQRDLWERRLDQLDGHLYEMKEDGP